MKDSIIEMLSRAFGLIPSVISEWLDKKDRDLKAQREYRDSPVGITDDESSLPDLSGIYNIPVTVIDSNGIETKKVMTLSVTETMGSTKGKSKRK